jgi:hypothetical protein
MNAQLVFSILKNKDKKYPFVPFLIGQIVAITKVIDDMSLEQTNNK